MSRLRTKYKKYLLLLCCMMMVVMTTSGCWDKLELEQQAYVIAVGIDKTNQKGIYEITYQVANPQGGTGAAAIEQKEPPDQTITIKVPGIIAGKDTANSIISRRLNFYHMNYLVVSEELARTEDFFPLVESLIRDAEISRKSTLIISQEKAREFLNSEKSKTENRVHKYYEFMTKRADETGLVPTSTLHKLLMVTEADEELFIAIYGTSQENRREKPHGLEDLYVAGEIALQGDISTEIIGSAVFKEGQMIGTINGEETRISHLLRPYFKIESMIAVFIDPLDESHVVTVKAQKREATKIKMNLKSPQPSINVTVPLRMYVESIHSNIDYVTHEENREVLRQSIEKELEKKFKTFVEKTQKEFKAAPFKWAPVARGQFLSIPDYIAFDWMKTYPEMRVNVDIEITFLGFGKQLAPPKYEGVKD